MPANPRSFENQAAWPHRRLAFAHAAGQSRSDEAALTYRQYQAARDLSLFDIGFIHFCVYK
jgi:hypothetical protein